MSIGPIDSYTANYNFSLISYDFPRWQSYEHDNWTLLDTTLAVLFGGAGLSGIWKNGVTYNVNERVIDAVDNTVYLCLVDHTAPDTGVFSEERAANPSYWRSLAFLPSFRGAWVAGTQYQQGDFVSFNNKFAVCAIAHLSVDFTNDATLGYWNVLIDLTGYNPALALIKANNLGDLASVSTARTNLGLGSSATHATTDFLQTANNLSDGNPAAIRTNLSLGSAALLAATTFLQVANNLSDIQNAATARTNLGLGVLATQATVAQNQINGAGSTGLALLSTTTPVQAAQSIALASTTNQGVIPALPSSGPLNYLRGDNTWGSPYYPGEIRQFTGLFVPSGWLVANGSSLLVSAYPALYSALVASAAVAISNASAAVVTWINHGLDINYPVQFTASSGTLPSGIVAATNYYVVAGSITASSFQISATPGGVPVDTSTNTNSGLYTGSCAPYGVTGTTNFNIPDLRGVFLRGLDGTRGFDPNRAIGLYQADAVRPHAHPISDPGHNHTFDKTPNANAGGGGSFSAQPFYVTTNTSTSTTGITVLANASGVTENLVKNYAFQTCIRAL